MNRKTLTLAVSLVAPWTLGCPQAEQAPPPPALGEQIDRMGRPGVTTALIDPININDEKSQLQNQYNADTDSDQWVFAYRDRIRSQMALYDGLDGVCGNSLLRSGGTSYNVPERYNNLSILFAYDALFLDTGKGNCGGPFSYLAVERGVVGFPASAVNDCGGRPPTVDVIDPTYTALIRGRGFTNATGTGTIPCTADTEAQNCPGGRCNIAEGATEGTCATDATRVINYPDGVSADAPAASLTDFPFLGAPQ
jgi:hypothetical protein